MRAFLFSGLVGLVLGVGITVFLYRDSIWTNETKKIEADPAKTVEMGVVFVAKADIDAGTQLIKPEEYFTRIPRHFVGNVKDRVKSVDEMRGKYLEWNFTKGRVICKSNLLDEPPFVPIPEGHQAVGLRISAGTLPRDWRSLPGSYVDLWWISHLSSLSLVPEIELFKERVLVVAASGGQRSRSEGYAVITFVLSAEDAGQVCPLRQAGQFIIILVED